MSTTLHVTDIRLPNDVRLLAALQEAGPRTLEELSSQTSMSWAQVFLAIDRLSRSGAVSLRPTAAREYQVSIRVAA